MNNHLIQPITARYQSYLSDESKEEGYADSISFPTSADDVGYILRSLPEGTPVTCQGANTGLDGLAVPHGGHVMNFSRMNRILETGLNQDGTGYAVVEPGVLLGDLDRHLRSAFRKENLFWPPSPTESSASIGGIAVTGACGMNSCHYGSTSQYITALSCFSQNGDFLTLNRDTAESSRKLDCFLHSASKAGPVTELTLQLLPKPEHLWGLAFFFTDADSSLACADALRQYHSKEASAWTESMEYLDETSIALVESGKETLAAIRQIPAVPPETQAMIVIELAGAEDAVEELLMEITEITGAYGSNPDTAWALVSEAEIQKLHDFRHAVTEMTVQWTLRQHQKDSRITRLDANPSFSDKSFAQAIRFLRSDLEKERLRAAVYAHIRTNDIHVTLLPENFNDYLRGSALVKYWLRLS